MLRLPVDDSTIPVMGRTAQGPVLMRLLPGESIVGAAAVAAGGDVLLISQLGQLKRLGIDHLRRCQRGAIGEIGLRFEQRNDALTDLRSTSAGHIDELHALRNDYGADLVTLIEDEPQYCGIAYRMTMCIVHGFKMIQIHNQNA